MKKCYECKIEKPLSEFGRQKKNKDGLQTRCKECRRKWDKENYQKNKSKRKAQMKRVNKKMLDRNLEYVLNHLRDNPCVDCGESDPVVLEFDHLPEFEKIDSVPNMAKSLCSISKIQNEIDKCEVRCCNCHRKITWVRLGGSWRDRF